MYPDFQYLFHAIFGVDMPHWLSVFKTFGFFFAMAFIAAAQVTAAELRRKEGQGLLKPTRRTIKVKGKNGEPDTTKEVDLSPHMLITEIVFATALGGIIGAKIFNALETWNEFILDPIGNLFSRSGLTFYGGFIVATLVMVYYTRRYKIPFRHMADAAAPAIMLAYGVGRLGCQFAGDGDWGIYNTAYVSQADASIRPATRADTGFIAHFKGTTPGISVPAPSGVPVWLVAMNYAHNVGGDGVRIDNCQGEYCTMLPIAVFPTPLYEATAGILLFSLMWALRKKIKKPLNMFACYLVFAGVERFFVEQIRVNSKYNWGFIQPTQAELISVILIISGIGIFLFYKPKNGSELEEGIGS